MHCPKCIAPAPTCRDDAQNYDGRPPAIAALAQNSTESAKKLSPSRRPSAGASDQWRFARIGPCQTVRCATTGTRLGERILPRGRGVGRARRWQWAYRAIPTAGGDGNPCARAVKSALPPDSDGFDSAVAQFPRQGKPHVFRPSAQLLGGPGAHAGEFGDHILHKIVRR